MKTGEAWKERNSAFIILQEPVAPRISPAMPFRRTRALAIRRKMTARKVEARLTYKTVTKTVMQCEPPYVRFGQAIAEARHALGLTQQELADKVGLVRTSRLPTLR